MSQTSDWPLPSGSIRYLVPQFLCDKLRQHPLSCGLYPVSFGNYKKAKGHEMKRLNHDDYLLIYCIHGKADLWLKDQYLQIQSGDILLLPPGVSHHYKTHDDDPWTIYWLHVTGEDCALASQHAGFSEQTYIRHYGSHPRLIQDFDSLIDCRSSGFNLNTSIYAACLLRQIFSFIALLKPVTPHARNSQLNLDTIHALMQENLHTRLDLDTLAQRVNLSKFHFVNKYKEMTGLTPIQHFLHLKIERACYLLDITQKSISEISYSLGYEDSYYFSRLFKKVMGIAPTQYRRNQLR